MEACLKQYVQGHFGQISQLACPPGRPLGLLFNGRDSALLARYFGAEKLIDDLGNPQVVSSGRCAKAHVTGSRGMGRDGDCSILCKKLRNVHRGTPGTWEA